MYQSSVISQHHCSIILRQNAFTRGLYCHTSFLSRLPSLLHRVTHFALPGLFRDLIIGSARPFHRVTFHTSFTLVRRSYILGVHFVINPEFRLHSFSTFPSTRSQPLVHNTVCAAATPTTTPPSTRHSTRRDPLRRQRQTNLNITSNRISHGRTRFKRHAHDIAGRSPTTMIQSIPRLEDYDVSPTNGFLPTEPPLEILPNSYYRPWESIVRNLQGLILSRRLRGLVDNLPVLSTDCLETDAEWRRAYVVLAFITHAYIWGGDRPCERIPPSISIPFTATCSRLELPTVATYAGVVLWNYKPLFPEEPIDSLENLSTLLTYTGSLDESWFYLVSVAIEARGAPIIPLMLGAIQAARYNDKATVVECLRSFAERLDELGTLLNRMYENCDSHVFYHRIRPFLAGSKNMADAGLPNGVVFDTGSPDDHYVHYSGGSNAQSSIIQFFDLVLGIEHRPQGQSANSHNPHAHTTTNTEPDAPAPAPTPQGPSSNFIHDMRTYMPGPHARFLAHVANISNIRQFVTQHRHDRALATAFDACLAMLRAFRDKHIQMVSRYIIVKSRESRSHSRSLSPREAPRYDRVNIANRKDSFGAAKDGKQVQRGTGGTALIPFLKQARDETGEPAIDAWARRLLNNGPGDGVRMGKIGEHANGAMEIVGLAGVWSVDDSDGGICHW